MSVMPMRCEVRACWLTRGRFNIADCASVAFVPICAAETANTTITTLLRTADIFILDLFSRNVLRAHGLSTRLQISRMSLFSANLPAIAFETYTLQPG